MILGICTLFIAIFGLQLADGGVPKGEYIPIKYPGPIQEVTQNRYGSGDDEVPPACQNQNFCTIKPPDYPQERFNNLFKGTKQMQQPKLVLVNFDDRFAVDEIDDCESTISYQPLYKVRSKRGNWRTVVQAPEQNYVQMVRLETCNEPGASCFKALPRIPGITTFCKQKTSVWEFLVSTENNGTEKVSAELPVCCSCFYKKN